MQDFPKLMQVRQRGGVEGHQAQRIEDLEMDDLEMSSAGCG